MVKLQNLIFGANGRAGKEIGEDLNSVTPSLDQRPSTVPAADDFYNEFSLVFSALAAMLFLLLFIFFFAPSIEAFFS
jgi:hypothetical protein